MRCLLRSEKAKDRMHSYNLPTHDTSQEGPNFYAEPFEIGSQIRRVVKRLTMWAYNHGCISFRLTEQIFFRLNLRTL